jgi:hypothetical protein
MLSAILWELHRSLCRFCHDGYLSRSFRAECGLAEVAVWRWRLGTRVGKLSAEVAPTFREGGALANSGQFEDSRWMCHAE